MEWFIIRHGLKDPMIVYEIEAALIDLLEISQNGPALNILGGQGSATKGLLSSKDVRALTVRPVMPEQMLNRPVFIFPIQKALAEEGDAYAATRRLWSVSAQYRKLGDSVAVGIVRAISQGAFNITSWRQVGDLWEFDGGDIGNCELHQRNYLTVISRAMGYWMRGNYLVVKFLPNHKFHFLRGSSIKEPQDL